MSAQGGYGTANSNSAADGINNRGSGDEEAPLLGKPLSRSYSARIKKHFTINIKRDWADIALLFCYIITGLLDSSSISIWGSFVSMQTGNTVYIGLGLANPHGSTRWIKSSLSLGCFCFGSFCFSRFHRYFSPRRRWVLCASFAFQTALIAGAAAIVTFGPNTEKAELQWYVLIPLALVAVQACGQAVASRALQYNALTSVVLTSIYCDLFSDANLFAMHNAERNRRTGAPILLLIGAVAGGTFAQSSLGIAGALWAATVLKAFIVVAWFLWTPEPEPDEAN